LAAIYLLAGLYKKNKKKIKKKTLSLPITMTQLFELQQFPGVNRGVI